MMRGWIERLRRQPWRRQLSFALALSVLLAWAALWLWRNRIAYMHPGPALLVGALAIAVGLVGWVLRSLQNERADLSAMLAAQPSQPAHVAEQPSDQAADQIPPIVGFELLTTHWQLNRQHLSEDDSRLLFEQLRVALAVAREDFGGAETLYIRKVFAGAKLRGGALLIQHGSHPQLVLKFDSQHNIEQEIKNYNRYVRQKIGFTPGEPRVCRGQGELGGDGWGAISYNLIGANDLSRLQTFGEYYSSHDPQAIDGALGQIFTLLEQWWLHDHAQPVATLYDAYKRLSAKRAKLEAELRALGQQLQLAPLAQLTADTPQIALGDTLVLRNPLHWIQAVFEPRQLGSWTQQRWDSTVHGDFHMGNLLISADAHGAISTWLIDFPHTGVGPTVQDLARLEADITCALMPLGGLAPQAMHDLAASYLPAAQLITTLAAPPATPIAGVEQARQALQRLRNQAQRYMLGVDPRPYYLALLHATLPTLYYRDRSPQQKLYALISAALLCERLEA